MRNRLRVRTGVGVAQLTSLAVVGVGLGLILGFMFMGFVDTVSCGSHASRQRCCLYLTFSSDNFSRHMLGMLAAPATESWISGTGKAASRR